MPFSNEDQQRAIYDGQVKLLIESAPLSLLMGILLFSMVMFALGKLDSLHTSIIYLFVFGWAQRAIATIFVKKSKNHSLQKLSILRISVFIYGVIWGVAILFAFHYGDYEQRMFLLFALMGLTSGAVLSFSADLRTSFPFYIASVSPVSVWMFFDLKNYHLYAIGSAIYLFFMLVVLFRLNSSILKSIKADYVSSRYIEDVEAVKFRLEKSEERYRSLVDSSRDGIVVMIGMDIVFSNPAFNSFVSTGAASRNFLEFVYPSDRQIAISNEKNVLSKAFSGKQDLRLQCGDDLKWVELNSICISWSGIPAVLSFVRDISETMALQEKLDAAAYKNEMERVLISVAEEQQRAIGRELHDNLGQEITGMLLQSQSLSKKLERAGVSDSLIASSKFISIRAQVAVNLCRNLAHGLVPYSLDSAGLPLSLSDLAGSISFSTDIDCRFVCDLQTLSLRPDVATNLYRIAQEAVSNSIRHSRCTTIVILLNISDGELSLSVKDDGVGVSGDAHSKRGIGMQLMLYRASQMGAELQILQESGFEVLVKMEYQHDRRSPVQDNPY